MKTAIIVQARMGSTRLPGKVLADIGGKPLIVHLLERLRLCQEANKIIVAMPQCDTNKLGSIVGTVPVNMLFWDGPENDVAGRFVAVIEQYEIDVFARICADSPFIDPTLVDVVLRLVRDSGFDYASVSGNCPGQQVQAMRSSMLLSELPNMKEKEREHILIQKSNRWSDVQICPDPDVKFNDGQLVDTTEDLEAARVLFADNNGEVPLGMMDI